MIVNRTIDLLRLRRYKRLPSQIRTVNSIRDLLESLSSEINELKQKLNKNLLPSFISKEKQAKDIQTQKTRINTIIQNIENEIKSFECSEQKISFSVRNYFFNLLKKAILTYRTAQQDHLRKTDSYNEYEHSDGSPPDECLLESIVVQKSNIRQSIFNLTNILLDLKMTLKSQTTMIDRIDCYFDETNFYLENANKEIVKIPGNHTAPKDMIIYFLIYIICVLLILVLIKEARQRH